MTDLEKVELAIRRAASQMPNHQSRAFRLLADELQCINEIGDLDNTNQTILEDYRGKQDKLD